MARQTHSRASTISGKPSSGADADAANAATRTPGGARRAAAPPPTPASPRPASERQRLRNRAKRIRAIVLDVDGVLTDAGLYYGRSGEAIKRFSARDGFAVVSAQNEGLAVAILSGRMAPPLRSRLRDLHVPETMVIEGSRDKAGDIEALANRIGVALDAVAFVGDDLPDLPALALVGLAACPADAVPEVRERCHLVCTATGGNGAVREVVETVLKARGRWEGFVAEWLSPARPPARGSGGGGRGSASPPARQRK